MQKVALLTEGVYTYVEGRKRLNIKKEEPKLLFSMFFADFSP